MPDAPETTSIKHRAFTLTVRTPQCGHTVWGIKVVITQWSQLVPTSRAPALTHTTLLLPPAPRNCKELCQFRRQVPRWPSGKLIMAPSAPGAFCGMLDRISEMQVAMTGHYQKSYNPFKSSRISPARWMVVSCSFCAWTRNETMSVCDYK